MKLVAKVLAALAVLALATPALACGDKNVKTADAKSSKETVAKAEKKAGALAKGTADGKAAAN